MFRSKFGSILKLVDACVSEIGMGIMCESLADLLALSKDVLEGVRYCHGLVGCTAHVL